MAKRLPKRVKKLLTDDQKRILALQRKIPKLHWKDKAFADSLIGQWDRQGTLTEKQWFWVGELIKKNTQKTAKERRLIRKKKEARAKRESKKRNNRKTGELCGVYLIKSTEGRIKIGYSLNVKERLAALKASSGDRNMSVIRYFERENVGEARKLEKRLHKICKAHHLMGEWFSKDAIELADDYVRTVNASSQSNGTNGGKEAESEQP